MTASGTTRTIQREYQIASAIGSYAGGGTLSAGGAWTAALVAYR